MTLTSSFSSGGGQTSGCEPPVPRWSTRTMSWRSCTPLQMLLTAAVCSDRGDAGTAGEVCEGIRPRRLPPCGHDDDAKPDPRPQTGVAVLGDKQRATLRGHALHDAGTQWQLGLRRRRRGEQDRERAGQHG